MLSMTKKEALALAVFETASLVSEQVRRRTAPNGGIRLTIALLLPTKQFGSPCGN